MPAVVAFVSQKGGVGKSTLARALAREGAKAGLRVKLADLDTQQGTSVDWHRTRLAAGIEPVISAEAYADLEREWRPLHQERIRAGKIAWWARYDVRFPGGDSAEYNYVTVTAFNRFQDMESSLPQEMVSTALQGKDVEGFWGRTDAARSMVRTEVLELTDQLGQTQ